MKSARISFRRSARASRHRTCENGGRTVFVSKCLARAQSFERSETADASPLPVEHGSGGLLRNDHRMPSIWKHCCIFPSSCMLTLSPCKK